MKAQWLKLAARFDAMQSRERWLVVAAVLGGIVLIGYNLIVDPAIKQTQLAVRSASEMSAQLANLQIQMRALQSPEGNPDLAATTELARLKQQLAEQAGRLEQATSVQSGSLVVGNALDVVMTAPGAANLSGLTVDFSNSVSGDAFGVIGTAGDDIVLGLVPDDAVRAGLLTTATTGSFTGAPENPVPLPGTGYSAVGFRLADSPPPGPDDLEPIWWRADGTPVTNTETGTGVRSSCAKRPTRNSSISQRNCSTCGSTAPILASCSARRS